MANKLLGAKKSVKISYARATIPEGIRITKVGLWFVLFTFVLAVSATNTGNNTLYMTLAMMFGVLVVSGVASRQNVRGLTFALDPPTEVFANRPFEVGFTLASRAALSSRWFLVLELSGASQPRLVAHLPRRGVSRGRFDLLIKSRGRHRLPNAHVSSLFPFGLFRKGTRHRVDRELLVFPELFPSDPSPISEIDRAGDDASRRAGAGHELYSLRAFRPGDDPRGVHWKQTARTGRMVYTERASETNRRLSVLFDNGVGVLEEGPRRDRFERLVSEAATVAVEHLARGYEVELVTRDRRWPFAGGSRQRLAILEALALVEPQPLQAGSSPLLSSDPRSPMIRLQLEAEREVA
jgi:uncharacterized protein (DUF58 family)